MKIKEAIDIFKIIYDQYGSEEGLLDSEICRHLNTAIISVMTDHFKNKNKSNQNQVVYGFESDQFSDSDFSQLMMHNQIFIPNQLGEIEETNIELFLPETTIRNGTEIIETRKCRVFHYASMERWLTEDFAQCKWKRHNEHTTNVRNPFRKST
jgi:hypothetical protein